MKNLGIAITGSFCTHQTILECIKSLKKIYNILPIVSTTVATQNTRFGKAKDFLNKLEELTQKKIVSTIQEAETIGPNNLIDILLIAPCTGNTLSKLANGITDNAVTMVCKSHTRNNKPVIIGISTNDALGLNLKNIGLLLNSKNYFFVPFKQDNPTNKPKSLVANWNLIHETILCAEKNIQLQPLISMEE